MKNMLLQNFHSSVLKPIVTEYLQICAIVSFKEIFLVSIEVQFPLTLGEQ